MSTDPFIPLAAAKAQTKEAGFQRLAPAPSESSLQDPAFSGVAPGACRPAVQLSREAGRITAIHVRCSCGQVIDLICNYPA